MMVLVTDGFFEWCDAAGEQYGTERLADIIIAHRDASSETIIDKMYRAVLAFTGGTAQVDDLTAVVIKKL